MVQQVLWSVNSTSNRTWKKTSQRLLLCFALWWALQTSWLSQLQRRSLSEAEQEQQIDSIWWGTEISSIIFQAGQAVRTWWWFSLAFKMFFMYKKTIFREKPQSIFMQRMSNQTDWFGSRLCWKRRSQKTWSQMGLQERKVVCPRISHSMEKGKTTRTFQHLKKFYKKGKQEKPIRGDIPEIQRTNQERTCQLEGIIWKIRNLISTFGKAYLNSW